MVCMGPDNKAADILCACSVNKGKTSIRMTRRYLTTFQDSQKSQHQCHQIDGTLIQNLSMSALGPTYGIYTERGFPELSDSTIRSLFSSRYGGEE